MTKPDSWKVNYRGLATQLKEGQAAILAALKELEDAGYIKRGKVRENDGKFTQDECTVYEKPCVENSRVDSSRTKVNTKEVSTEYIDEPIKTKKFVEPKTSVKAELSVQELDPRYSLVVEAMSLLVKDRAERRKPMTKNAQLLAYKHLYEWYPEKPELQVRCIERSIAFGWTGLFPLQNESTKEEGSIGWD